MSRLNCFYYVDAISIALKTSSTKELITYENLFSDLKVK